MSVLSVLLSGLLSYLFTGTAPLWVLNGSLYVSLHSSDPGGVDQDSNEVDYVGYARSAVLRNAVNWQVAGNAASNKLPITFAPNAGVIVLRRRIGP